MSALAVLFFCALIVPDQPVPPARSPDGQVLASTKVDPGFVTPEGANYQLLLNGNLVYPARRKHRWFHTYEDQHTFLSDFVWSPDSEHVAFVEKVYDWEYLDPYNRYFDGTVSNLGYYLVIVSRTGAVAGYPLSALPQENHLAWGDAATVMLNDRSFDLRTSKPGPIR